MTTRALGRIAVLIACLVPAACATSRYSQSRIETMPKGVEGRGGASATLEIHGVKLRIESLDRVRKGEDAPRLSLRMRLEPRELGYSFDPGQVVLRFSDGRVSRPYSSGYRLLERRSIVDLAFDAGVESTQTAELVVGGLARGTKPLAPVTLRLARHDGTSIDRMYWLEAIGIALAAPFAAVGAAGVR
jgi:hypothetical protein